MLKCYYLAKPVFDKTTLPPAYREALVDLTKAGLIIQIEQFGERTYRATGKGRAWVQMLLDTPFPEGMMGFQDPRTGKVITRDGIAFFVG